MLNLRKDFPILPRTRFAGFRAPATRRRRYNHEDNMMANLQLRGILASSLVICLSMGLSGEPRRADAAPEPLMKGLGSYTRKVTTKSPLAQRYFDQGLAFLHGFNHGAAIRSFQEAARLDPECAMAHWAIALACGPHINLPLVPPPAAELAWKELGLAKQYRGSCTPVERDLIEALGHRYANPQPEDRSPLDRAYADAMRDAWQKHPKDPDVGVFFAEALMDLRPWDQWTPEGQPQPGTEEVVRTLNDVLKLNINHPFANHLLIHAVEASRHPERADAAAERLRKLQPGVAHNVHMPTHIDIRRGRWQQAIDSNEAAVKADAAYRKVAGPPKGFISVYIAHNRHMLVYAAMMTGQSKLAIDHIRAMVKELPPEFLKEYGPAVEGFVAMPMEVLVRFGKWDEVLAEPDNYPESMPFTRAFHHAARAVALAAKGDTAAARREQATFRELAKQLTAESTFGNNPGSVILGIADHMAEGEILIREGKPDAGYAELREAIKIEDALHYDEPPGWLIPVRHSLGAALIQAGRYSEAEQVYRDDLARLPGNGWSLYGLAQALRKQNKSASEATDLERRFRKVWAKADLQITSSCLCIPGN
jgi:tetratricopeptide (TPR) repeat protein